MFKNLLTTAWLVILLSACASTSRNSQQGIEATTISQPDIPAGWTPDSLINLPRTEEGAFLLAPGFYEAEFKTYCLQPGTPDPTPNDAYLQAPMSGYRKEIVETILYNSRSQPGIPQRNVQLLLWSVVSKSDFNKLPSVVQSDARQLLSSKQIFELQGGVIGVVKRVSNTVPTGVLGGNNGIRRLFEVGTSSYEAYEKIAVLREPARIKRAGFKNDQWYKQDQNFYVRHFPVSYQKIRIQVYVPEGTTDSTGKVNGEYLLFDPTGLQTVPANSNAQRLGIGGPVLDIVKVVIKINKANIPPKRLPGNKPKEKLPSKT
jgi:hypothetical protein